jgi:hypothetical protein
MIEVVFEVQGKEDQTIINIATHIKCYATRARYLFPLGAQGAPLPLVFTKPVPYVDLTREERTV